MKKYVLKLVYLCGLSYYNTHMDEDKQSPLRQHTERPCRPSYSHIYGSCRLSRLFEKSRKIERDRMMVGEHGCFFWRQYLRQANVIESICYN